MSDLTGKDKRKREKKRGNNVNVRKFHPLFNNNEFISESEHDKGDIGYNVFAENTDK